MSDPSDGSRAASPGTARGGAAGRGTRPGARGGEWRAATRTGGAARQANLREHNLSLVLRMVVEAPTPVSRADVAAATGLTRATVSALVDRLVAAELVAELEPVTGQRAGRPAVPLVPARGTVAALGMEINVDYLGVRALDLAGRVVSERVELGDLRGKDPAVVLDRLATIAGGVLAVLSADGVTVAGTALALPGLVDRATGPLRYAPNLGWRDLDVVAALAAHPVLATMPPHVANEATLAARAEAHARRAAGPANFVYVSGEIGIGGAIVIDGQVFLGRRGWSGEIGHVALGTAGSFEDGGTLEDYAGQDQLLRGAGLDRAAGIEALVDAARAGDPVALASLESAGAALGVALAGVVNVVDVPHVVLGSHYGALVEWMSEPVLTQLRRRVIAAPWTDLGVTAACAGEYPAMTGGALGVLEQILDDPFAWTAE